MRQDRPIEKSGKADPSGSRQRLTEEVSDQREEESSAEKFFAPDQEPSSLDDFLSWTPPEKAPEKAPSPSEPTQTLDTQRPPEPAEPQTKSEMEPAPIVAPSSEKAAVSATSRMMSYRPSPVKKVKLKRIDPWSTLKFSVLFFMSIMAVILLATMILFFVASAAGYVGKLEQFVQAVGWPDWRVSAVQLFRAVFLLGIISVVFWSGITLFIAFLYNLIADILGGIEVTVHED